MKQEVSRATVGIPSPQGGEDVKCCHPALSPASQIALTLRAVGGLTTAEIARVFLMPETTMTWRITRAKQRIKDSNLPFGSYRAAARRTTNVPQQRYLHARAARLTADDR
ncbi:sigma factor-like helix-turn-helix DNA-binding protein [Streptosporangium canum]|uniref:sigma factor-like helix-turn-helix DNA-binding protein n=1 Tax=Streptosporangium canum TaxID=324952 RepID=UPI003F4E3B1F